MRTTNTSSSSMDVAPRTPRRRGGQRALTALRVLNPARLPPHTGAMDDAVRDYIDAIAPEHRPLFDRLHRLVLEAHPDATVVLSYQMPTYKVGRRRLFVGVWRHGVSVYGVQQGRDGGFSARHPELKASKGPSGCGPRTPPASPTRSSATWCARPSTADHAPPATHTA